MAAKTTIAIVQMCATSEVQRNVDTTLALATSAAAAGAKAVFVPEAFAYIGSERERRNMLEPLPAGGPILERCADAARSAGIHLVLGGFAEAAAESPQPGSARGHPSQVDSSARGHPSQVDSSARGHPSQERDSRAFNTCVHLAPSGEVAALYRKIHLFDVDMADGTRVLESRGTAPGDRAVVTEMPFGLLGLSVCYDMRFPMLYQALADLGAVAITVPSAFFRQTGSAHWHVLLRARAIETQCYIIAPAQHGDHGHRGRQSYGHGLVVDPWGEVIAEYHGGDGFALAEIDPARVASVRAELPSLANRRAFT